MMNRKMAFGMALKMLWKMKLLLKMNKNCSISHKSFQK